MTVDPEVDQEDGGEIIHVQTYKHLESTTGMRRSTRETNGDGLYLQQRTSMARKTEEEKDMYRQTDRHRHRGLSSADVIRSTKGSYLWRNTNADASW